MSCGDANESGTGLMPWTVILINALNEFINRKKVGIKQSQVDACQWES